MSDDELGSPLEHDTDDYADGDYQPLTTALPSVLVIGENASSRPPQTKSKRGRKPNTNASLRSAREAARKANHSVIEKKRRERINQALTELRTLVPADDNDTTTNGKDFKLEVLVRTVSHLKRVTARVTELEDALTLARTRRTLTKASSSSLFSPRYGGYQEEAEDEIAGAPLQRQESTERVQLPSVSSLLMSLPTPPSSGRLSVLSSPAILEAIPPLQLPTSDVSSSTERHDSLPTPVSMDEQAIHTLLCMSSRQRTSSSSGSTHGVRRTPAGMLDILLVPR